MYYAGRQTLMQMTSLTASRLFNETCLRNWWLALPSMRRFFRKETWGGLFSKGEISWWVKQQAKLVKIWAIPHHQGIGFQRLPSWLARRDRLSLQYLMKRSSLSSMVILQFFMTYLNYCSQTPLMTVKIHQRDDHKARLNQTILGEI